VRQSCIKYLKQWAATPILCGVIGDDDRKEDFIDLLTEENLSDIGIRIDATRLTTVKTRIISGTGSTFSGSMKEIDSALFS